MNAAATKYTSNNGQIEISIRQAGRFNTAWACHVNGRYIGSKCLPKNNTAIVQNFGYLAADFKAA